MSLYRKLVLFFAVVVVGPVIGLGALLLGAAQGALTERIERAQRTAVQAEADAVAQWVLDQTHALSRTTSSFLLTDPARYDAAAKLLYRASPDVAFVALVDGSGQPVSRPILWADPANAPEVKAEPVRFEDIALHPGATLAMVGRVDAPLDAALAEGPGAIVMSPVYAVPERQDTAFLVLLPVRGAADQVLTFVVELSLRALSRRAALGDDGATLAVVDGGGLSVAHADPARLRARAFDDARDRLLLAEQRVELPQLSWTVVSAIPRADAFAPVRRLRLTVGGVSLGALVLLLALARAFVGRVRRGLDAVGDGALAYQKGDLAARIEPPAELELRALATTFNTMGDELEKARDKLLRWNEELEEQVDERTRELRETQASLIESQKLAAVGQLGAGVAHEINNPLSGVLGFVQLLEMKLKKLEGGDDASIQKLTKKIEESAKRCRDVTTTFLRFSQRSESAEREEVSLNELVEDVAALNKAQLSEANIDVKLELADPSPRVNGDAGQLSQVVLHLVTNARTALADAERRELQLSTAVEDGRALLRVRDTGKGMNEEVQRRAFEPFFTTKDVWTNLGLGLYASFRIVEDHGGRMGLQSTPGEGTTLSVELPLLGDAGDADEADATAADKKDAPAAAQQ
jgi:signal transduction histidine kinase